MAQITTTDANEFSSSAEFTPMRGFSNCHLQTMLPRLFRRKVKFTPYWQRLELPDGDFVDLAWSEDPAQARHKPRLVVFHGLEGSLNSPYAHGLVEAAQKRGWLGVVMHFRGCSGEPNRMHRIFHMVTTGLQHKRRRDNHCRINREIIAFFCQQTGQHITAERIADGSRWRMTKLALQPA